MAFTPFRQRIRNASPGFLREGTGERLCFVFGAMVDARIEKLNQGVKAHLPILRNPNDRTKTLWIPPPDALAQIGAGMVIERGLTESDASYGARLQRALDSYRYAGTARGVLGQILGYLLALTPAVRMVWTRYDRSTSPPTRESSTWQSYPAGRDPNIEPENVDALAGGAGDFEWDDGNTITGGMSSWSSVVVVYSVAPNAWTQPAQAWGAGSTYTGSGDYSTVSVGAYVATGFYTGVSQAWGLSVTTDYGQSIARIVKQFKPASTWVRSVAICFTASRFDPADTADGIDNPAGECGTWSDILGTTYIETRFTDCAYGGEVV